MDDTKITQIDIRQSAQWAECLKMYGWNTLVTNSGVRIQLLKNPVGGFAKIQKPNNLSATDFSEIEQLVKENKVAFVLIEPSEFQNVQALKQAGYVPSGFILTPARTLVIDLIKTVDELWNDVSKGARYSINRAQREGARIETYKNPSHEKLVEFYNIYKETGVAKKYSIKSFEDLKKRVEVFKEDAHLIHVYNKESQLTGGKFYLGYNSNCWYIYGGTSSAGRKDKTGYELLWKSILYLKEQGYKTLDLDGIYDPRFPSFLKTWGGFSHFKERFGGRVVDFPVAHIKYYNRLFKYLFKVAKFNP